MAVARLLAGRRGVLLPHVCHARAGACGLGRAQAPPLAARSLRRSGEGPREIGKARRSGPEPDAAWLDALDHARAVKLDDFERALHDRFLARELRQLVLAAANLLIDDPGPQVQRVVRGELVPPRRPSRSWIRRAWRRGRASCCRSGAPVRVSMDGSTLTLYRKPTDRRPLKVPQSRVGQKNELRSPWPSTHHRSGARGCFDGRRHSRAYTRRSGPSA